MRQCPLCARPFADSVEFCPRDGRLLLAPDPLLGRVIDGKYRVESLAGAGGQGAVYRAEHVLLQRMVAVKIVPGYFSAESTVVERFKREGLTIARLKHPHIVTIHDFGIAPEIGAYIVMEFLEGHSLRAEIGQRGRIPIELALDFVRQICLGVHAAHLEGIVHRDLKPDNVFLEGRATSLPTVKILDFGLAKLRGTIDVAGKASTATDSTEVTLAGRVFGTPAYMSPEQCRGEELDARSDIYSVACLLYEMICGRPPFTGATVAELVGHHVMTPPEPLGTHVPGVPEAVERAIQRALAKHRDMRFSTADEFGAALAVARADTEPRSHAYGVATPVSGALEDLVDTAQVSVPNNLPNEMTSFIGREREASELVALLGSHRLVTITGPSGSGKSRLALRVAAARAPRFADGVWLVELAPLAEPSLVPGAIAAAVGAREEPGKSPVEVLRSHLRDSRVLLVLDNCEHLVDASASAVRSLLLGCPHLRVLATSQEALRTSGEAAYPLPPLPTPDPAGLLSVEILSRSDAVRLFVDRARLGSPTFALTNENGAAVASICHRLDGIPLAIELAAARVKALSVEQIAARLEDRFRLLTGGDRTSEPRRRTLLAAIDWSHELLGEEERRAFRRLSVFAGGFTLDSAEALFASVPGDALGDDALELVTRLIDKSLVLAEGEDGRPRYRMFETIRHYAADRLQLAGEAAVVRTCHRDVFGELARSLELDLLGSRQDAALDLLESEHDNLRAALEWAKHDAAASPALLRTASALARFWFIRGHSAEGRVWLEAALASGATAAPEDRGAALQAAGTLARRQGDFDDAERRFDEALALRRELGDPAAVAESLNELGAVAQSRGEFERAWGLHAEALDLSRAAREDWETAASLNHLGITALNTGDLTRAAEFFEESLALFRSVGDPREISNTLNNLGVVSAGRDELGRAWELFNENLMLRRGVGDMWGTATSLNNLGSVAQLRGDYGRAGALLEESLLLYDRAGDRRGVASSLESMVAVAAGQEMWERAATLAGAAAALRHVMGSPLLGSEADDLAERLAHTREAIGDERYARAIAAGEAMSREAAVEFALNTPTVDT